VVSDKRLKSPLLKKNGELQEAMWDDAIGATADQLKAIIQANGPDSVGVLVSAKITNEENYTASVCWFLQKLPMRRIIWRKSLPGRSSVPTMLTTVPGSDIRLL
jgi:predicted molibdopterin-dependent oxidoreductase YjgC